MNSLDKNCLKRSHEIIREATAALRGNGVLDLVPDVEFAADKKLVGQLGIDEYRHCVAEKQVALVPAKPPAKPVSPPHR